MSANPNIVWIDPDVCEKCMICVEIFACPAIQRGAGNLVPWIHAELCNGNGSCIQVCPIGAIKRPSAARFGVRAEGRADTAGGQSDEQGEKTDKSVGPTGGAGYKGGPTQGSKTEFAGKGSGACK